MAPETNREDPIAALSVEEKETLAELAKAKRGGVSRRELLKLLGIGGLGALAGGGATFNASSEASAGTGQAGSAGEPGNPIDLFAEDVFVSDEAMGGVVDGYIVPVGDDLGVGDFVDPRDFADDSAALQAAVDKIVGSAPRYGTINLPGRRPDGTQWSFPSTVTFGDTSARSTVNLVFWGGSTDTGSEITTTINDGSSMFRWAGDTVGGSSSWSPVCLFPNINGQANDVELIKFSDVNNFRLYGGRIRNFIGSGVVADGASFGFDISSYIVPQDAQATPTADCVKFVNDTGNGPPGNGRIHSTLDGPSRHAVNITVASPGVMIGGLLESSDGSAAGDHGLIHNTGGGHTIVTPFCKLADARNGSHGIFQSAGRLTAAPSEIGGIAGDAIKVTSGTTRYWIGETIGFRGGSITGDSINAAAPTSFGVVPRENAVEGTVSYPTPPWSDSLRYHDGWKKQLSISNLTVSTGGSGRQNGVGGAEDQELRVRRIKPSATGQVAADWALDGPGPGWFEFDNSTGNIDYLLEFKTDPGSNMDFDVEIERRV